MVFYNTRFSSMSEKELKEKIREEENRYYSQIALCAENILNRKAGIFLLAGGSCCGKTTTATEIKKMLEKEGKKVFTFSTDDFFFDEEYAPVNYDGTKNFDKFSHTDSDYICKALKKLIIEDKVLLPTFDYTTRKRNVHRYLVDPKKFDIVILEGIHALNDKIVQTIPESYLSYRALLSYESPIKINETDSFTNLEARFFRRLIRDFNHRDASATETFGLWKNVLSEEKVNIDPFRKNAEMIISTSFDYEICVEKKAASKLLRDAFESPVYRDEAKHLYDNLEKICELDSEYVPEDSVINEFIR